MRSKQPLHNVQQQRGISLIGLIFIIAILGFIALIGMKVLPTFSEYRAILNGIKEAKRSSSTVRDAQVAFDTNASPNYIESISGKDLIISRETGEIEISFAYEKRIPLAGPVSLVIDYAGSTAKNSKAASAGKE